MTALSLQAPIDLSPIRQAIGMFGIPNPITYLEQADADPDIIRGGAEAVQAVSGELTAIADLLAAARSQVQWQGAAAIKFAETVDGIIEVLKNIAEFLLGLVEALLRGIDAIIDLFRTICTILIAAATIISAIVVVAAAAAGVTFGGSLAAAAAKVWAVASSTTMTIIGLVATVAVILKFILDQLNTGVEWIIEQVASSRQSLQSDRMGQAA